MSTNYLLNVNYLTTVNYLLTVGRGNIVTTGRLATPLTLPLDETTAINNIELVMLDEAPLTHQSASENRKHYLPRSNPCRHMNST